ncbi:MAG: GNAT family N-acetyltransferase [Anaerolineales bacterium]|nr:GNAT family N-acetyltransferase [Anaerolineales bacterium]
MPPLSDLAALHAQLGADQAWSVYALGDLAPGFAQASEWHVHNTDPAGVLLLYRAFATPVLFALGPPETVALLLDEVARERALYLSVLPEILPLIQARYRVSHLTPMWRMTLAAGCFQPVPSQARRLTQADLPALEALYADGAPVGEAPDFFSAAMLSQGVYYGVFEGAGLAAAAGTHLVASQEGVAAIGNVYTRRDRRGRGLASQVTSAVAADLLTLEPPLAVIALNVRQDNLAAVRIYERLGFRRHRAFYEGLAVRL